MVSHDDSYENHGLMEKKKFGIGKALPLAVKRLEEVDDTKNKESGGTANSD